MAEVPSAERKSSAPFLLIIPGGSVAGLGAGLLTGRPAAWTLIGFGLAMLLWGALVALRGAGG